jgi:hypothetical protein
MIFRMSVEDPEIIYINYSKRYNRSSLGAARLPQLPVPNLTEGAIWQK